MIKQWLTRQKKRIQNYFTFNNLDVLSFSSNKPYSTKYLKLEKRPMIQSKTIEYQTQDSESTLRIIHQPIPEPDIEIIGNTIIFHELVPVQNVLGLDDDGVFYFLTEYEEEFDNE